MGKVRLLCLNFARQWRGRKLATKLIAVQPHSTQVLAWFLYCAFGDPIYDCIRFVCYWVSLLLHKLFDQIDGLLWHRPIYFVYLYRSSFKLNAKRILIIYRIQFISVSLCFWCKRGIFVDRYNNKTAWKFKTTQPRYIHVFLFLTQHIYDCLTIFFKRIRLHNSSSVVLT